MAVFVSVFSTLGAVIDTALSVTSSVYEVWTHKNSLVEKELTSTGYQVGKEIIGTTVNTLLFKQQTQKILQMLRERMRNMIRKQQYYR